MSRCDNGAVAVEFALISMVMLVVSLGIIEFGRGLYLYNKISHAADLAARKALTKPDSTDSMLTKEIQAAFSGQTPLPTVEVETPDAASDVAYRIVVITLRFTPLVPTFNVPIDLRIVRRIPMLS